MIDRTKEWTLPDGRRQHVSPWTSSICWATVNLDTMEVLAVEDGYMGDTMTAVASCNVHQLIVPEAVKQYASDIDHVIIGMDQHPGIEAALTEFRQFLEEAVAAPGVETQVPYKTITRIIKLATGKPVGITTI